MVEGFERSRPGAWAYVSGWGWSPHAGSPSSGRWGQSTPAVLLGTGTGQGHTHTHTDVRVSFRIRVSHYVLTVCVFVCLCVCAAGYLVRGAGEDVCVWILALLQSGRQVELQPFYDHHTHVVLFILHTAILSGLGKAKYTSILAFELTMGFIQSKNLRRMLSSMFPRPLQNLKPHLEQSQVPPQQAQRGGEAHGHQGRPPEGPHTRPRLRTPSHRQHLLVADEGIT